MRRGGGGAGEGVWRAGVGRVGWGVWMGAGPPGYCTASSAMCSQFCRPPHVTVGMSGGMNMFDEQQRGCMYSAGSGQASVCAAVHEVTPWPPVFWKRISCAVAATLVIMSTYTSPGCRKPDGAEPLNVGVSVADAE